MNGFIKRSMAAAVLVGSLVAAGCHSGPSGQERYHRWYDPCWPQRYSAVASESVNAAFGAQVGNGHVLDQTIWNEHFEPGTAVLTPGGMDKLAQIARRRPSPDPQIFLQTAYDMKVTYDPENPNEYSEARTELDNARMEAIQRFVEAHTVGRPVSFVVNIHDPSPVGMGAVPMQNTIQTRDANFRGVAPISSTAGGAGIAVP